MTGIRSAFAASLLLSCVLVKAAETSEVKRTFITNFLSDTDNCGWFGHVCPDNDPLGFATCNSGQCGTSCNSQCFFSNSARSCQPNLPSRCGTSGTNCPAPKSNGRATCNNGSCGVSCDANTQYDAGQNDCVPIYTTSCCGLSGQRCPAPSGGNGQAYCSLGHCGINCNSGYVLDSTSNTCIKTSSSSITSCPVYTFGFATGLRENCNSKFSQYTGGTASCTSTGCAYTCSTGFTSSNFLSGVLSSTLGCVNTVNNNDCCGSSQRVCKAPLHGSASCKNGACVYSCDSNYSYDSSSGTCKPTGDDCDNCGFWGNTCWAPNNAQAFCNGGICSYKCNDGYVPWLYWCVKGGTQRARVRAKRDASSNNKPQLCPVGETACPIAGSASLSHVANTKRDIVFSAMNSGALGYECLDTTDSLESCGGCSSTGEGQDCTKIAHAADVGCRNGTCTVLQCAKGYTLSSNGATCTRSHKAPSKHSSH